MILGIVAYTLFAVAPHDADEERADDTDSAAFVGELDLSTPRMRGFLEAWTPGRIPGDTIVLEVARVGGQIVALGIDGTRAAAWTSAFGDKWQPASVQTPTSERSVISDVVGWHGEMFAYGRLGSSAAVWRETSPDRWDYTGDISAFGSASLIDIAASGRLLAVAKEDDDSVAVYVSGDAVVWSEVDETGLGDPGQVRALAALDEVFYAVGTECSQGICTPSVHRSEDGAGWESVALPTAEEGSLEDITVTTQGLIAVGSLVGGDGAPEALILSSSDGIDWVRLGAHQVAFARQAGTVELVSTTSTNNAAAMLINGQRYDLGVGATVRAETMRFSIVDVADGEVTLQFPDSTRVIRRGEPVGFEASATLKHVAAQGDRIVVAGTYVSDAVNPWARVAGVWATRDGGAEWARSTTDGGGFASALTPYLASTRILVVGLASGETQTWASEWDTGAAGELDYAAERSPGS